MLCRLLIFVGGIYVMQAAYLYWGIYVMQDAYLNLGYLYYAGYAPLILAGQLVRL